MPWPVFIPLVSYFVAFTWFAFDAAGLPPSEQKRRALMRSAMIFIAVAVFDFVMAVVGQHRFAVSSFICFSPLPIGQAIAVLWQRSRLAEPPSVRTAFIPHSKN
jgi:hypothetical protein